MTKTYEATVAREGQEWRVAIPELSLEGRAARLSKAEGVARSLIAQEGGNDPASIAVTVVPVADPAVLAALAQADATAKEGEELVRKAARMRTAAVREYVHAQGLTVRDAAALLGISHQRVQQLIKD